MARTYLADKGLGAVEPVDDLQGPEGGFQVHNQAVNGLPKDLGLKQLGHGLDLLVLGAGGLAAVAALAVGAALAAAAPLAAGQGSAGQKSCIIQNVLFFKKKTFLFVLGGQSHRA